MVFKKEFFKKVYFEQNQQTTKKHAILLSNQGVLITTGIGKYTLLQDVAIFGGAINLNAERQET